MLDEFDISNVEDAVIANADSVTKASWERVKAELLMLQPDKAEIAAILVRYDLMISNPHCEVPDGLKNDMERLRQL